jgi:basic membrane protein A
VKAALITNPRGTSVFINEGIDGFEKACQKWGIKGTIVECKDTSEYESNTRAAANEGYELIIGASWEAGSIISELAEIYDDISFGIIDTMVDSKKVKCVNYYEAEGAYLVGVIAALTVDGASHNYGSINVSQSASSFKWRYGFAQGVLSIDPQAKFTFNYVNGYSEVALANELARQQYEKGCLFINSCAAGGDTGTFQAALDKKFYTAGQDVDLTSKSNPYIITCQLKGAGESIEYLVDLYMEGKWNAENETLGVADGAIGAIWATRDSQISSRPSQLSDADMIIIKQAVEDIKSGKINMRVMPEETTGIIPLI